MNYRKDIDANYFEAVRAIFRVNVGEYKGIVFEGMYRCERGERETMRYEAMYNGEKITVIDDDNNVTPLAFGSGLHGNKIINQSKKTQLKFLEARKTYTIANA